RRRTILSRHRYAIARADFQGHRQVREDDGLGEKISAIPRSLSGLHRGRIESAGRAAFIVANGLEETAMIEFGAPNWFWALLLVPSLVLLFIRAEKRAVLRLRSFV